MDFRIFFLLLPAAVFFSGCATTIAPQNYIQTGEPTLEYPKTNNPEQAYNYARGQWDNGEYREAAKWFEKSAASAQTETNQWELECLLNATVCWMEAGDRRSAKATLAQANDLKVLAPPSKRASYLNTILLQADDSYLPIELRSTLPRGH